MEREVTFENNSDMEVKVTQKQSSQAFVKETQWSKTCSTVKSTWQAKHRELVSMRKICAALVSEEAYVQVICNQNEGQSS